MDGSILCCAGGQVNAAYPKSSVFGSPNPPTSGGEGSEVPAGRPFPHSHLPLERTPFSPLLLLLRFSSPNNALSRPFGAG